jgi:hypothetical protein
MTPRENCRVDPERVEMKKFKIDALVLLSATALLVSACDSSTKTTTSSGTAAPSPSPRASASATPTPTGSPISGVSTSITWGTSVAWPEPAPASYNCFVVFDRTAYDPANELASFVVLSNGNNLLAKANFNSNTGDGFESDLSSTTWFTNTVQRQNLGGVTPGATYQITFTLSDSSGTPVCTTPPATIKMVANSFKGTQLNGLLMAQQNQTTFYAGDSTEWQIQTASSVVAGVESDPLPNTGYTTDGATAFAYLMTPNGLEIEREESNGAPISKTLTSADVGNSSLVYLVQDASGNSALSNVLNWTVNVPENPLDSLIQPGLLYSDGTAFLNFSAYPTYQDGSAGSSGGNYVNDGPITGFYMLPNFALKLRCQAETGSSWT